MTAILLHNVHFQFADSRVIFSDLTHSFLPGKHGLVGDNGSGKSVLAGLICGLYQPTTGSILRPPSVGFLSQQFDPLGQTVADFLGISQKLNALKRVFSGAFNEQDLLLIEDDWHLEEQINQRLLQAGIHVTVERELKDLSGGELLRLRLMKLFSENCDWLVLDEPSNHLDLGGRKWLADQITSYQSNILLISHDRQLLELMSQIHELSDGKLTVYGGNFSFFRQQKQLQQDAQLRRLMNQKEALKNILNEEQKSRQRAERRAKTGKKLRISGSQCKLLLDKMKDNAESHQSVNQRNAHRRITQAKEEIKTTQQSLPQIKKLQIAIGAQIKAGRYSILLENVVMPYGNPQPISLTLSPGQRCWLQGNNGSGKSTLLKMMSGEAQPTGGDIRLRGKTAYFDQRQSLLKDELSALDNLKLWAKGLSESEYRTQLANIGFRGEKALRKACELSGGERVKLALLAITAGTDPVSVLLLDEPDNHLDLQAREMFEQALKDYRGTLVVVSHDVDFVEHLDIDSTFVLSQDTKEID